MSSESNSFTNKVLTTVGITLLAVITVLLLFNAAEVFLLIFTGILFAVFLRGIAKFMCKYIPVKMNIALTITIILLLVVFAGGGMLLGPSISSGIQELTENIPSAVEKLEEQISRFGIGQDALQQIKDADSKLINDPELMSKVTGIFSSVFGAIANIFIILIIGLYSAFEPGIYLNGFVKLFPKNKRDSVREVLSSISHALGWWLVGRFISMFIVGVLTIIGLSIIGVPLAFTLGIIAALLDFIPNIGPIIAAVPAILIALVQSPAHAFYVILLYIGIQSLEGYLIAPVVERKTIQMPPAVLLSSQVLMGILLGMIGLLLASPIMVVIIVIVQIAYVKNTLGDEVEIMGNK